MSYRYLLMLLGAGLMAIGILESRWYILLVWLGANFLALGVAHFCGFHSLFGKRPDGSLPVWSWIIFLPMHLCNYGLWHLTRFFSREPAFHAISDDLVVGRRLLPGELAGDFANYVDLTAEFAEPRAIRCRLGYISIPILDGSAPGPQKLAEALQRLRSGRTYIHCAQGHGRTGLFVLALLLHTGAAKTVGEGLAKLQAIRPGISLSPIQRRCIEGFVSKCVGR